MCRVGCDSFVLPVVICRDTTGSPSQPHVMLVVFGAKPDHMVKQAPITKRRRLLKLNTRTIAKQCRLHVSKSALLGIFGLNESFSLFLKDLVDA